MKKLFTTLLMAAIGINLADAQIKTTGVVTLTAPGAQKPITLKLDADKATGLLTMTATGPADRMFYIGFGGPLMENCTDAVAITKLGACDQLAGANRNGAITTETPYIAPAGNAVLDTKGFNLPAPVQEAAHNATSKDAVNDWTVISDDGDYPVTKATRTVVATRPLNTQSTEGDYIFDYDNLSTLKVIWAAGRNFVPVPAGADGPGIATNPNSPDNGYWSLSGSNTVGVKTRHDNAASGLRGVSTLFFIDPTAGKSSGEVTLTNPANTSAKPMTLKLDLDQMNSRVYMTVTGPADRMFYIGFGGQSMAEVNDAVAITKLGACDQLGGGTTAAPMPYIAPAGNTVLDTNGFGGDYNPTAKDVTNDWVVLSDDGDLNDLTKTKRTVIAYRPFNTNSSEGDYVFDYNNLSTLNVIWAQGRDAAPPTGGNQGDGYWALSGANTVGVTTRHGGGSTGQRGTTALSFTNLGIADNAYSEKITVYPNPAKNIVNVLANSSSSISTVRIFDMNAKLLKVVHPETMVNDLSVDISNLRTGIYFMEISNDHDKTVKKIIKE